MAESTASLSYTHFCRETGHFIGYGRGVDMSDLSDVTGKPYEVDRYVNGGIRMVQTAYDWPFMKPVMDMVLWADVVGVMVGDPDGGDEMTATEAVFYDSMIGATLIVDDTENEYVITDTDGDFDTPGTGVTVSANFSGETSGDGFTIQSGTYRLPDNFGHIMGDVTFASDDQYASLVICSELDIRRYRQSNDTTGVPYKAAVRYKNSDLTDGQRMEMLVYPRPDSDYTASFRFAALPDKLGTTNLYPLGGLPMSELYLQACLASAEQGKNRVFNGPQWGRYQELLAQTIERFKLVAPESLGPGYGHAYGDRGGPFYHASTSPSAFNGQTYP